MKQAMTIGAAALLAVLVLTWSVVDCSAAETPAQAVLDAEAARIAVMDKAKDSVLAIFPPSGEPGGGSGVVISADGYGLTNFHVAKPCGNAMKCGMADGELYDAVIVGVDPTGDIALIKLFGRDDFPHAELADSDKIRPGDWCFAMGNPFLLATDFQPTVTYGIVSGTHRYQFPAGTLLEYTDCIQTDASINPGNSGGPLFDAAGRLIGINGRASFEKRGRVNVGIAYAISINQIKNFMGHLRSGRIVDHATLGATVGWDEDRRVVVNDIIDDSDAYRRGLRYDDEIIEFGGRQISTPNAFKNVLGILPKGWRVPLSFRRDGKRYDILVRLQGLHGEEELLQKTAGRPKMIPMPIPKPGEKPKDEKPGPGEKPKQPKGPKIIPHGIPIPIPGHKGSPKGKMARPKAPPMPEIVKKHFEKKRGYANYYFNKLNRDRILKAWTAPGKMAGVNGAWTIDGKLTGGGDYHLELTGDGVLLKTPNREYKWTAGDDLAKSLDPPQSGGLLAALYLWRRLAVEDAERFGDLSYLGTGPLAGREKPVDVLVGSHKGVECRYYFDADSAQLLALEFFPDEDVDPCEILFSDYRDADDRSLPGQMEIRVGDDVYAILKIDDFAFDEPKKE